MMVRGSLYAFCLVLSVFIDTARAQSNVDMDGAISDKAMPGSLAKTCETIEMEANNHGLPPGFLARLIWRESRFNPNALSPKGARGIAQFMPATARERGLADPFDPGPALAASAAYLKDLKARFGNLGLAAAAYNSGPNRVARWRSDSSHLPGETRAFVRAVTGLTADEWSAPDPRAPDFTLHKALSFRDACMRLARPVRATRRQAIAESNAAKPWGALIATHFTQNKADAALKHLAIVHPVVSDHQPVELVKRRNPSRGGKIMYRVVLGADDRDGARALCTHMKQSGGACIVVRN